MKNQIMNTNPVTGIELLLKDEDIDKEEIESFDALNEDVELEETRNYDLVNKGKVNIEDSFALYLDSARKRELLTAEEEIELGKKINDGKLATSLLTKAKEDNDLEAINEYSRLVKEGNEAKNILVESNLRLVMSIANSYRNRGLDDLDVIEEGNVGLIKAADKFDYNKGFRFSTYATWWIRQSIIRAIYDNGKSIRLPAHSMETLNKAYKIGTNLVQELGREPSLEDIHERLDGSISLDQLRELYQMSRGVVSLETPMKDGDKGDNDKTLGDLVADNNVESPSEYASKSMLKERLMEVLGTLREREQRIIFARFGLGGEEPKTLEEVGKDMGITRERVRQIETVALKKLRHPTRRNRLEGYID